jgi:hypothetical protein
MSPVPYEGVSSVACLKFRPIACLRFRSAARLRSSLSPAEGCGLSLARGPSLMGTGRCLPGTPRRHGWLIPPPRLPAAWVIRGPPADVVAMMPARGSAHPGVAADTAARARAAAGREAPASPRKPLLRLIISVVSCRVHETVQVFPAVPEAACRAARRARSPAPAVPPTAGTCAGFGGSAPICALGHGRAPTIIRPCLTASEQALSAVQPQTCGV